jgi:hypothetical protein
MFAAAGILALILVDYLRPQEWFPFLHGFPLLHLATAAALVGMVLDLRLGLARLRAAPHLVLTLLFFAWCLVTVAAQAREQLGTRAQSLVLLLAMYLLVAHGIQSFRMLQVTAGLLLAIALGLALVGTDQGLSHRECHRLTYDAYGAKLVRDGRPCTPEERFLCETEGGEPGFDYLCEKVGLFDTQTDHGRVRFRGTLQDPNELSLVLGIALPFAFAFLDRRRSAARGLLVAGSVVAIGICTYFTQSRGGQLVFLSVLGIYFVRRFGWARGVVVGLVLAGPVILFGGRSGSSVDASTMERLECWWVGLHLAVRYPLFGVGQAQFTDHHYLTAHSSFILVAAELGVVGMLLWGSVAYVALKVPIQVLRACRVPVARTWALALLASTAGLLIGSMFLSYAFKSVFWLYIALTGALYQAVRQHDPGFEVGFGFRDLVRVSLICGILFLSLVGYTEIQLGW